MLDGTPKNGALRRARLDKGWTQRDLAKEVGVEEQTVGSWERGSRIPSLTMRTRLCETLKKSPEELGFPTFSPDHEPALKHHREVPTTEVTEVIYQDDLVRQDHFRDLNQRRMLMRVQSRWVSGKYLFSASLIDLYLHTRPDVVENGWRQEMIGSYLDARSFPTTTSVIEAYDEASGELLILGEPGSGKTTLLLLLIHQLLERAQHEWTHPIPILFNLSSWSEKHVKFESWLVEELNATYLVSLMLAQEWVEHDQVLPLLDGLDEVDQSIRSSCVTTINTYRREHGLMPMVVCCRTADYQALPSLLILSSAVVIQPLTAAQIDAYVLKEGDSLAAMRVALQTDPLLQEMASTPLMLNVLTVAYSNMSVEDLLSIDSLEVRRRQVFAQYIQRVFQRRHTYAYTLEQTQQWLSHMAEHMARQRQYEFYVERMQPNWLPEQVRHGYRLIVIRLVYGIDCMLIAALFAWLRGGRIGNVSGISVGLFGWLGATQGNSLLGWMAPGLGGGLEGGGVFGLILGCVTMLFVMLLGESEGVQKRHVPFINMARFWRGFSDGIRGGIVSGGIAALGCGLIFSIQNGLRSGIASGASYGLFCGLIFGLLRGIFSSLRQPAMLIEPDPQRYTFINHVVDGIVIGLCGFVGFALVNSLMVGLSQGVVYGLVVGLAFGLVFGGGGTNLIQHLGLMIIPAETIQWSWQRIIQHAPRSLKESLGLGLSIMPSVILVFWLASGLFHGWLYGLRYGCVYGIILGSIVGVIAFLADLLKSGWSNDLLDEHDLDQPNLGIRRSWQNALFAGLLFGPIGGIVSGMIIGGTFGVVGQLPGWPIVATGFAIIFTLIFFVNFAFLCGGIACIEHYVLRLYLWRKKVIPLRFVHFLNFAAENILLRRIGGGYVFIHRLLLEYFSSRDENYMPSSPHSPTTIEK